MEDYFNLFGFKINTREFILTLIIFFALVIFLIGVDILWFKVSWYGFLIGIAFILAVLIASELSKEKGLNKELPYELIWLVFPLSMIGARIFYVINSLNEFPTFIDMLKIWEGGLSIYGGIIGGTLGVVIYCLIKKLNILKVFDICAPVLILGQAIGRWGNFINKEVYGLEITNPAFQWFPIAVNINNSWHMATFFYESIINLGGFFVLLYIIRKTKTSGITAFTYLIWYGTIRLILESLRVQQFILYIPGTNIMFSSVVSIIMIASGVIGLVTLFLVAKNKRKNI